ncbi:hypothetical protein [Granulicella arctica]|uniref:hypothetical protein n=1 Tax=Granulicella arctica TaxID=940613 RepID=UPI0021E0603A|nr:hypothetical protein [Granulicella arctica]
MKNIWAGGAKGRLRCGAMSLVTALILSGCHHRQAPPTLPPILQAPDAQPPTPESPSMVSPPPDSVSQAPAIKVTQAKPKRASKKNAAKAPVVEPVSPPVDAAMAAPTAEGSIGELSAGGDSSPKTQQATAELIESCEHRVQDLQQSAQGSQPAQLRNVRYFLKQAKQALGTGDAEAAKTLATKAKLLLDDLTAK